MTGTGRQSPTTSSAGEAPAHARRARARRRSWQARSALTSDIRLITAWSRRTRRSGRGRPAFAPAFRAACEPHDTRPSSTPFGECAQAGGQTPSPLRVRRGSRAGPGSQDGQASGRSASLECWAPIYRASRSGNARVTAAVRLDTWSLSKMFCRWVRTVPSDTPSRRAIWAFVCPAATRRSNSRCRGVS